MKGQQTQAQLALPAALTVVALLALCPLPVTIPDSPEPWSPVVSCQGAGPSSKPASAVAESAIGPGATHTVCSLAVEAAWPDTDTEHHERWFFTVSATGVAPEHVAGDDIEPPLLLPPQPETAAARPTATPKIALLMAAPPRVVDCFS